MRGGRQARSRRLRHLAGMDDWFAAEIWRVRLQAQQNGRSLAERGAVMDFNRVTKPAAEPGEQDETVPILTTHSESPTDETPLQFISAAKLAYHRRLEAAARALASILHKEP
jgi:hypothetical protein